MIDPSRLLANLPKSLRDAVLTSYQEIMTNYLERRWEPAELNGGKFCEAVYSIISGAVMGKFPVKASKPKNMLTACQDLEKEPADSKRIGDRSLRVLIPRTLPALYDIRNNRGVGHIGGDVDPNHMDAERVQADASWVMAELVRIFHGVGTVEAQQAVDALVERKTPMIWEVEGVKRVLEPEMKAKDQVLLLLHHSSGWVTGDDLLSWIEYSSKSMFRSKVLRPLHRARLIEFDEKQDRARLSPSGAKHVDEKLLPD